MREDAVALLNAFGVTVADADPLLDFIISAVTERIKNETNQPAIPEGLNRLAMEMVAGQYLSLKKALDSWRASTWKRRSNKSKRGTPTRFLPLGMVALPRNSVWMR